MSHQTPSVLQFEAAVKRALARMKPPSFEALEDQPESLKQLLSDKAVCAYLTRPFDQVRFDEKGDPIYESDLEKQLYEVCARKYATNIPYRAETIEIWKAGEKKPGFYGVGRSNVVGKQLGDLQSLRLKRLHNQIAPGVFVYRVTNARDFIGASEMLRRIEDPTYHRVDDVKDVDGKIILPNTGVSCLVFDTTKNDVGSGHAFAMIGIIDNATRKVKTIININTQQDRKLHYHYELRCNEQVYRANRAWGDGEHLWEVLYLADAPYPILDASLNLQLAKDDKNCGLYSNNFVHAMLEIAAEHPEMIRQLAGDEWKKDPRIIDAQERAREHSEANFLGGNWLNDPEERAQKMAALPARMALVKKHEQHDEKRGLWVFDDGAAQKLPENEQLQISEFTPGYDWARLREAQNLHFGRSDAYYQVLGEKAAPLQRLLCEHLPEYFRMVDGQPVKRPDDEIKQEHLRMRWEIGSAYINDLVSQTKGQQLVTGR